MKKAKNVSKALMKATGVAVFGSVIACGAALMAMHEGFKTAGNIVKRATEEDDDETVAGENVEEPEQKAKVASEIVEEPEQVVVVECEVIEEPEQEMTVESEIVEEEDPR